MPWPESGVDFSGPCAQAHGRGGHVHRDVAPPNYVHACDGIWIHTSHIHHVRTTTTTTRHFHSSVTVSCFACSCECRAVSLRMIAMVPLLQSGAGSDDSGSSCAMNA